MSFARTKVQAPRPRVSLIERAALRSKLSDALRTRRLVLLCAPAGYGKTSALAREVADMPAGHALAWVSADAGDDLHRLLDCMVSALEAFDPPWRTAPEALVASASAATADVRQAIAAEIINTLEACDVPHGVIVFDDLHRVSDRAFFAFLDLLIERSSEHWTIAITAREEPPLALARLRAAGQLAEFRQLQLQFARDEARALAIGAGLDDASADVLFERTQGWPAGMQLAIGAARDHGVRRPSIDRPLFDYLVTEVLEQLRPELADFLLRVCVLPELQAARCAAVAGTARAALLLDEIERLGLFVDVLDAPVRTLRLHDLFREALERQLDLRQPLLLVEVRKRAAASETDPVRRITWLLAAGDAEQAARLLYAHAPLMIVEGAAPSVLHLISRFEPAWRDASPELRHVGGLIGWLNWDFAAMLSHMERAEAAFALRGDVPSAQFSRAYRACAVIARGRADEGAALLATLPVPELPAATRVIMLNGLSWHALETGALRNVAPFIDEMLDWLESVDRPDLWFQTTPPTRLLGLPGMARPLQRQAANLLRLAGESPTPLRAMAVLMQAWHSLWQGRLAETGELLERARDDARWCGEPAAVRGYLLALTARWQALCGERAAAVATALSRVAQHQAGYGDWGRYQLLLFAARIAGACEDLSALRDCVQRIRALAAVLALRGPVQHMQPQSPVIGQLAWLEGRAGDAIASWQEALADEERIEMLGQAAETRVRLALAWARADRLDDAALALQPVFERASQEGEPGGALLAGDALRELAALDWHGRLGEAQRALLHDWWQRIATYRAADVAMPANPGAGAAGPEKPAALSPREQEVLRRIAAGDSNKLIARAFELSPHTVKRHVAHILDKLGVESRGQAAAWYRAQAVGN